MRARPVCALVLAAALVAGLATALGLVGSAAALPANPWAGQWIDGSGAPISLTQSGSSITGTARAGCTGNPTGVVFTGMASADNTTASFSYSGAPACPGEGGTFTGRMRADGRAVAISGVTQFGTVAGALTRNTARTRILRLQAEVVSSR